MESSLQQAVGCLSRTLQPLGSVSDKAVLLAEEVKSMSTSLILAQGSSYEDQVVPLMKPIIDSLQNTEEQIKMKLEELESVIAFSRSQLMNHMVSVSDVSGVSLTGDFQSEQDEISLKLEEVGHDVEMAQFTSLSLQPSLLISDESTSTNGNDQRSAGDGDDRFNDGTVLTIPDRNPHYCGSGGIYMQKLQSCIINIHADAAATSVEGGDTRGDQQQYCPEYISILGAESGLGKSELAREYCQLQRGNRKIENDCGRSDDIQHSKPSAKSSPPSLIGWISAADEASLVLSYRELALSIKAAHPTAFCVHRHVPSLKKDALFSVVNSWIQRLTEPWILVIDNLDSEDILISQSFLPFWCSSPAPCTVIITSRLLDLPFRWEVLMDKKSADLLSKHGQQSITSVVPAVLSASHQRLSQEIHALSSSKIGAVHMFPLSETDAYDLAVFTLEEEIDAGSRWKKDGQKYVARVCEALCFSPLAIKQAFLCIKMVQKHRAVLKEQCDGAESSSLLPLTQVERLKEYSNWLEDCRESAENSVEAPKNGFTSAIYQTTVCALTFVCEKTGHRLTALDRALGLLAFISPVTFDVRMLDAWFRPPNTPYLAKIQKKWRMPNITSSNTTTSKSAYNMAEFEILVESVRPVMSIAGKRFSWRVFRSFDRIKDCIDAIKKIYAADISDRQSDFPLFSFRALPVSAPDDMMEEAVSRRRVEMQNFFEKLVTCRLWGRVCTCESMKDLLGIEDGVGTKAFGITPAKEAYLYQPYNILDLFDGADANKYPLKDDESFSKLISPLLSLGFVTVFKRRDISIPPNDSRSWLSCCMSRDTQVAIKSWLKVEGRYDQIQSDVVKFLNVSFRNAYQKYKRGTDVFSVKESDDHKHHHSPTKENPQYCSDHTESVLACEQLILHVLSVLASGISSCHEECFELSSLAYHFCADQGLFAEALFCATFCVEVITQREGSVDSVEDGVWHSFLADMLCSLNRGDEANSMYEHSLLVLRKKCGHYHKQTFSVLARFGQNLFKQGKYKHSIKIMEEALSVCRKINSKASGVGGKLLESFSPSSSKPVSTITSLPVADQIERLVEVLLANAPDFQTVRRCLELKREQLLILRRAHGEYSLQVARCLNSMGELEQKGHSKKAREFFEDCLDVLVRCVGGDSRELIAPLHNLAMEDHAASNFKEAKKLYQRAIEIHGLKSSAKANVDNCKEEAMIASVHDSLGMLLGDEGDYTASMHHLEKGYQMYCSLYGSENHEVSISLSNLARAWQRIGDGNMAKSLYSKSLKTLRQLGGRADEDIIARNLNALGEIYMGDKEYDEARQLFMECLSARVNLYGEKHADTVSVMKNLSVLAFTTGSYEEAHTICFTARAIQVELDGTDATVQAAALTGHLAEISRVLGKISDAEAFYKNAISLYQKIYGENHPSISLQINNMAAMFVKCKRFDEAEALYESSRRILINFHGEEHSSVASSISNLAMLNGTLGRYTKAMTLYSESLGMLLKLHGSENKIVADALMDMAKLLMLKKDFNDATDACSQALGIRSRLYGSSDSSGDHGEIIDSLHLMGQIKIKTREAPEAKKLLADALRMQVRIELSVEGISNSAGSRSNSLGERNDDLNSGMTLKSVVASVNAKKSSLKTADIIEDICRLLCDESELGEKMVLFEKCLQIRRTILGEENEIVADSLAVLGEIMYHLKLFSESIELQRVARAIKVKIRGENHPTSILSLNGIAKCLKALGRLDEARSMFEQCVISTRRLYGDKNFSCSVAIFELSRMLQLVEEYDTATTMAEQALSIRLQVERNLDGKPCPSYGNHSPNFFLAQLYQHAGELSKALGDAVQAKVSFQMCYNLHRDTLDGLETESGIDVMMGLAWALESLGNHDEAASLNTSIKDYSVQVYATKDASYVQELNDMGKILRSRGKYCESQKYFTKALNIGKVIHNKEHINLVDSTEGLAWLKEVRGESEEAAKLHAEVAVLRAALGDSDDEEGGLGAAIHSSAASLLGKLSLLLSEKTE